MGGRTLGYCEGVGGETLGGVYKVRSSIIRRCRLIYLFRSLAVMSTNSRIAPNEVLAAPPDVNTCMKHLGDMCIIFAQHTLGIAYSAESATAVPIGSVVHETL